MIGVETIKKVHQIIIFTTLLAFSSFAQELQVNSFDDFSKQVSQEKSIKEIDQVISNAKNRYKTIRKKAKKDKKELAKANLEFALFRQTVFQVLNEKFSSNKIGRKERFAFLGLYENNSQQLEKLLEVAIEIYEKSSKVERLQLAKAKFELAVALESYKMVSKMPTDWNYRLKEINKIQNLYLHAFKLREKLLDKDDDLVKINAFHLANAYLKSADYENSLIYYEKYISMISEKYGRKSKYLLPALWMKKAISKMIGQNELEGQATKQILEITEQKEDLNDDLLFLSPRVKSFSYKGINKIIGELVYTRPIKLLRNELVSTSIGEILKRGNAAYKFIVPGRQKFNRTNVIKAVVLVDTEGKVIDVKAETTDLKIEERVESEIKKWEFKPFNYKGRKRIMKGFVYYYDL